ncbi:MAG: putative metal-binding motif-containing protein, partial [Deltaproteobacteria bacterium]|nr:putative metal-binding motif-containing protein [Deltaproteobacteria bacterium]
NPGVNEKCTTAYDDNCNTSTNEQNATGCTNFYYDFDGDGYYATGAGYQCWCAASGYYRGTSSGDCNDSCSTCYPGASEVCDYLNNDCDSYTDEGFYDADANFLYDSGFNSSYDPVCTYYSPSWYDYDNAWYGPTLACRSTGGSLSISDTARILPSGDVDWLSVASGEYYVDIPPFSWGTSVKCEAQLTGITGESYEVCVCWSRNTQCDITSFDCKTSTGSSVAARTDMSDNLAVDDYGWCDIRIKGVGSGDYHCSQYNLTVTVWE